MLELFSAYSSAVAGLVALATLVAIQFAVADVAGIRAKHIPGMPITTGHRDFLFRATRAHANTNENLPLFLLLFLACVMGGASAQWTANWVWVFVIARLGHMLCYYADQRLPRSGAFVVGTVAQVGLLVLAAMAALG